MKALQSFYLFMLLITSLLAEAQIEAPEFRHLGTGEGLSQNSVFSILKDSKGFMWFATDDGLNRYDGYKFTVYKHDPDVPGSLVNNSLSGMVEDADANLWIITAGGLDRFDRSRESFVHYSCGNGNVVFRNIFLDSKKRIWIGSTDGFCLFDPQKKSFVFYRHNGADSNSLSHNYVYRIIEDNEGMLWIATRYGLNIFNPQTGRFRHFYNDPGNAKSIAAGYIKTLFKDQKGNIWIGTQGSGVDRFEPEQQVFIHYRHDPLNTASISHNDILSFSEDADGRLWIGTENGGISVLDAGTKSFTRYQYSDTDPYSLSGNSVYCLYRDNIGNMWVGTWSGGINFLPLFGNKFKQYAKKPFNKNSLSSNMVLSITGDSAGYVWIGTDGGGLNRFNPATGEFKSFENIIAGKKGIYNNYVVSVAAYKPGILALGFHRGGIDIFNTGKNEFKHYVPADMNFSRLTPPSVYITFKDRRGNLWLGTNDNGGLFMFNGDGKNFDRYAPKSTDNKSIGGSLVYSMYETRSGELWVGGDRGLDHFDRDTKVFTHYRYDPANRQGISNNNIYCINEDDLGNLWLGTAGGLNYFNRKTNSFKVYTEKDGLANNVVYGILQDRHGNLWITTNKGLSRFDPLTKAFRNFDLNDGLQSNTFKAKAAFQNSRGEMFIGGVNGFNSFFPDSIRENNYVPPVYLTGFEIFNKPVAIGKGSPLTQSISEIKEIMLAYDQSVFTIEYAALNYTRSQQNKYAYMLEGFDKDWNQVGNKRTATYTNLNPGTYIFRVKGSNNDGVWNENGAAVKIIVLPPFWLTWWFITGLVLLISGSILLLYRHRVNNIKRRGIILQQLVNQQTLELVHLNEEERKARLEAEEARVESEWARNEAAIANKELQGKNKELEQFAYVASHDLQEPLRTTASFVNLLTRQYKGRLDERGDKYLSYISDAASRMQTLITDLLDFSRIGSKGALARVDCNEVMQHVLADIGIAIQEANAVIDCEALPVIMGYPTEIKLLFQNLLINSIKFRKPNIPPLINISVQKTGRYQQFAFKDNGIGMEKQYNDRIFNIFQRLHTRAEYEGSGIGLSHCKKIVELHQGKIWVESMPGLGSVFYFTLYDVDVPVLINNISRFAKKI